MTSNWCTSFEARRRDLDSTALSRWPSTRVYACTSLTAVAVVIEAIQGQLPGLAATIGVAIVILGVASQQSTRRATRDRTARPVADGRTGPPRRPKADNLKRLRRRPGPEYGRTAASDRVRRGPADARLGQPLGRLPRGSSSRDPRAWLGVPEVRLRRWRKGDIDRVAPMTDDEYLRPWWWMSDDLRAWLRREIAEEHGPTWASSRLPDDDHVLGRVAVRLPESGFHKQLRTPPWAPATSLPGLKLLAAAAGERKGTGVHCPAGHH